MASLSSTSLNNKAVRNYLLAKPECVEDYPFGPDVAVMKVREKMFATYARNDAYINVNLKCDPDEALMLRRLFDAVLPGYHMNKRHWNTIVLDGTIPKKEIERMIDRSYSLVVKGLKKSVQEQLVLHHGQEAIFPP